MRFLFILLSLSLLACSESGQDSGEQKSERTETEASSSKSETESDPDEAVAREEKEPIVDQDSIDAVANGFLYDLPTLYYEVDEAWIVRTYLEFGKPKVRDTMSNNEGFKFRILDVYVPSGEGDEGIEVIEILDSADVPLSRLYYWSGTFGDTFFHTVSASIGDGNGVFLKERIDGMEDADMDENGEFTGRSYVEEHEHEYRYDSLGVLKFSQVYKGERKYLDEM